MPVSKAWFRMASQWVRSVLYYVMTVVDSLTVLYCSCLPLALLAYRLVDADEFKLT